MIGRYAAPGDAEPGSRGQVLRNLLGIRRVREMDREETLALESASLRFVSDAANRSDPFTAQDIRALHRDWLAAIYSWAGEYRSVDVSKGGFLFCPAVNVPREMERLEREVLARLTPCRPGDLAALSYSLAEVHAELNAIHPFREGNGRAARTLAVAMSAQAETSGLSFRGFSVRQGSPYIRALHAAGPREGYDALAGLFLQALREAERVRARDASAELS